LLRDLGSALSPFNAFQIIQGLETLPLRIRTHSQNAAKVVEVLQRHPAVERVIYPGVQDGEFKRRAETYLQGGFGGLVGFELKDGHSGAQFIDALKLFYHVANIGDARSLAIHPATTTHSQLSAEDRLASGVSEKYVRLSIGIEHIDDIEGDLLQALDASSAQAAAAE
jgi:O-acetylhomoserine (thiol)-lyase